MQKTLIIVLLVAVIALAGVIVYQKLTPTETTPIVVNQPVVNQPVVNQPANNQPPTNCVKEGEQGGTETNTIANRQLKNCCSGLNKVDMTTLWEGACENASGAPIDLLFTCIKCGNGVCGKGENQCNCPQDCK